MSLEQWFSVPQVFLLVAMAAFGDVVLIFAGVGALDLIDRIRTRIAEDAKADPANPTAQAVPEKHRTPIFVPKPVARRKAAVAAANSIATATEGQYS